MVIVDVLEVVDIQQDYRERRAVPARTGELLGEQLVDARAVPQPGEPVKAGAQGQPALVQEHGLVGFLEHEGAQRAERQRGQHPDAVQALHARLQGIRQGDQEQHQGRARRGQRGLAQGQAGHGEGPHQSEVDLRYEVGEIRLAVVERQVGGHRAHRRHAEDGQHPAVPGLEVAQHAHGEQRQRHQQAMREQTQAELILRHVLLDQCVDQVQRHGQEGELAYLWQLGLAIPAGKILARRARQAVQRVQRPCQPVDQGHLGAPVQCMPHCSGSLMSAVAPPT